MGAKRYWGRRRIKSLSPAARAVFDACRKLGVEESTDGIEVIEAAFAEEQAAKPPKQPTVFVYQENGRWNAVWPTNLAVAKRHKATGKWISICPREWRRYQEFQKMAEAWQTRLTALYHAE